MARFLEQYSWFIGLITLTLMLTTLFSTPSMILAKSASIGTELSHATSDELVVRTKINFGSNEHMQAFTRRIGNWTGTDYEDTERYKEQLGADVLLMRNYAQPRKVQPIDLLLMQSSSRTSFHSPVVCYPALGYMIEEDSQELVMLENASWAAERWMERRDVFSSSPTIAVKKLVVTKQSETGMIVERRVVLYFYVKERPLESDTISMVRVSAFIPVTGPYDEIVEQEKGFLTETFPYLFEVRGAEPRVITMLATGSLLDKLVLLLLVLAPLAVTFYPQLKAAKRSMTATERQE